MAFSYWERNTWLDGVDYTIIGSGIVGLMTALHLREAHPTAKILVLERGLLPNGASTKNAGFACFGSVSEIISDLESHTEDEVVALVEKRLEGLKLLRHTLGSSAIAYKEWGGYELFLKKDAQLYAQCMSQLPYINALLYPIFKREVFSSIPAPYNFSGIEKEVLYNAFEGQIDTGKMMAHLLQKVMANNILVLNHVEVLSYQEADWGVTLVTESFELKTKQLFIASNGFAKQMGIDDVRPARAQVVITKPIDNLAIQGTFHLDEGYYYFRNIDNRILLGGGRNLDFKAEETTAMEQTDLIQKRLESLLTEVILPKTPFEIDQRWSGIMGVGPQKKPKIEQLSERVYCGVRLGGMGVAIGSLVGKELAALLTGSD